MLYVGLQKGEYTIMNVRGKIEKTVEIDPLDVLIGLKSEFGLNGYFIKNNEVYKSDQCSLYGDYKDVLAPEHIREKKELLISIDTLCNYLR